MLSEMSRAAEDCRAIPVAGRLHCNFLISTHMWQFCDSPPEILGPQQHARWMSSVMSSSPGMVFSRLACSRNTLEIEIRRSEKLQQCEAARSPAAPVPPAANRPMF
ncbi:hypothetical protein HL666_11840 [Bradyrhizobium sp. 83002]|uniref:hypothetical protein n=1 Tax=Bradyrhizobium aeschynomenes TaxID=2734909 RepID=UPI0015555A92|nr:hypothetical protein [Bradyrhizobium aeschynomenes]NPU11451.1 hypothetical protein [Bradyrhizobium aeschynomenes]